MGAFRNNAADVILEQNRTDKDKIILSIIYLIITVLGLIVNSLLINYYRNNRRTWMHKFCYALAIVCWIYMMIRGVPTNILRFDPDLDVQLNKVHQLKETLSLLSYLGGAVAIILIAAIIVVQHTNIFYPGWTLLHGPSTCWKRIIIAGFALCFVLFAPAMVLVFLLFEHILFINSLIFNIPHLMIAIVSLCVYLATRLKFRKLERELSMEVREKIRREFKLVNVMAIGSLIFSFACSVVILKLIYEDKHNIIYLQIVAMVEYTTVSCAMLWCDQDAWDFYFKCTWRRGYISI